MSKYLVVFALVAVFVFSSAGLYADSALGVANAVKLERAPDNNLLFILTDYQFDFGSGNVGSFVDVMRGLHVELWDGDPLVPMEQSDQPYSFVLLESYYDFDDLRTINRFGDTEPAQGIYAGLWTWDGSSPFPYNEPLFKFKYLGENDYILLHDGYLDPYELAQVPVPAAVPEPATLLGFGVPMLMVGLGRLRGFRK